MQDEIRKWSYTQIPVQSNRGCLYKKEQTEALNMIRTYKQCMVQTANMKWKELYFCLSQDKSWIWKTSACSLQVYIFTNQYNSLTEQWEHNMLSYGVAG